MELRRFHQFVTLVQEGSFTAAAAKLFMAQSSLSTSIAGLERDLGVQLVTRTREGVELTAAGRAVLEPVRRALADVELAKAAAAGSETGSRPLRIGDTFASAGLEAETAATELCTRHPGLQVEITHYGLRDVTTRVMDGELDIAFTPVHHPLPEHLDHIPMGRIRLAIICATSHPLAGASGLTVADLAGQTLIAMPGDSALLGYPLRSADADSYSPVRVAVDSWLNAISLVRRGFGITLGPRYDRDYYPPDVAIAELADPPVMDTAIVTRAGADQHHAVAEYVALYRSTIPGG